MFEVGYQVVDMLRADRQADRAGIDVLLFLLPGRQLRVGGRSRMNDQTLHVGHIGKQRENLERVNEASGLIDVAFDLDGENRTRPVGKITLVKLMVGVIG